MDTKKLKEIYAATPLRDRLTILWHIVMHLCLFLIFILAWPVAWIGSLWTVLFLDRTPYPKKFDAWCVRVLMAPARALFTEIKPSTEN
jgi:hypothetical protein